MSIAGVATRGSDPIEQEKVGALMLAKFPQITKYLPANAPAEDLALFRIGPSVISLLDYRKGFGHTELVKA